MEALARIVPVDEREDGSLAAVSIDRAHSHLLELAVSLVEVGDEAGPDLGNPLALVAAILDESAEGAEPGNGGIGRKDTNLPRGEFKQAYLKKGEAKEGGVG